MYPVAALVTQVTQRSHKLVVYASIIDIDDAGLLKLYVYMHGARLSK